MSNIALADRPVLAALLIVGGMGILGVVDNMVQVIARDVGVWQFHAVRGMLALPMIAAAALVLGGGPASLVPKSLRNVLIRSLIVVVSMLLYFASIPMMPMAQVAAGLFTSPLFVLVFSVLFLGERIGIRRVSAVIVGFAGAVIIIDPFQGGFTLFSAMPVVAGGLYALSVIATRSLCRQETPWALLIVNYAVFVVAAVAGAVWVAWLAPDADLTAAAPFLFRAWQPLAGVPVLLIAAMAMGSIVAVGMLTRAYQSAESSFVALFDYSYLIWASVGAFLIWGELPGPWAFVGAAMIMGAGIYIALRSGAATANRSPAPGPETGT